ncbi:MAG: UDP-3-O-acyl-N-acetylglucosamine deacetylase [Alphaproteobacteria bacterium MarineAlpha5_Bin11]|nr:UDP-3-O-[3-hydroxymyristoyl] N-acetylglucosamine deacetylase [Pelagibacteraceae bacterium]PPR43891.1 MAG: UDP-3-O-acyl-N-acetylglucosamine deacetylase [Alphaproteobacteria bacterium MarineAlpha5_Bin11]PPR51630.1 MAG: UDP-3-O-acyl-N-acetylglucosamine deacetylase [Alphaproteobacteria bacterium MarineAlpha5_Bin10]|tara:strand:- start:7729 stop:8601 length:873 start_codon:yes stop_codon:yes gene_type:complete
MITEKKISNKQKTLKQSFNFEGIGLHSGITSKVTVYPERDDYGIVFIRKNLSKNNEIRAHWSNVTSTKLCTTISNNSGASVQTIEHLMSALSGMHIDNAKIEVEGPEIPIMDGSAEPFVKLIEKVGVIDQSKDRKYIRVLKEVIVEGEDDFVKIRPHNKFSVEFEIDFPSNVISNQSCHLQMINGNYKEDISKARTFGFIEEVDKLRSLGFALGGSLDNAIVIDKDNILNKEGLRYADEFVRHKILDSIGDLYLAGSPVIGYFEARKSGHKLNNKLLEKLLSKKSNWTYV